MAVTRLRTHVRRLPLHPNLSRLESRTTTCGRRAALGRRRVKICTAMLSQLTVNLSPENALARTPVATASTRLRVWVNSFNAQSRAKGTQALVRTVAVHRLVYLDQGQDLHALSVLVDL